MPYPNDCELSKVTTLVLAGGKVDMAPNAKNGTEQVVNESGTLAVQVPEAADSIALAGQPIVVAVDSPHRSRTGATPSYFLLKQDAPVTGYEMSVSIGVARFRRASLRSATSEPCCLRLRLGY